MYEKVISLTNYSMKKANIGKIINLVSNDLNVAEHKIVLLFTSMNLPIFLILSGIVLYDRHGYFGILMIVLMILLIPF